MPVTFRARALSTLGGVDRIGIFIGPFIGAAVMQFAGITGAYWVGVGAMAAAAAVAVAHPGPRRRTPARGRRRRRPRQPTLARRRASPTPGSSSPWASACCCVSAVRASRQAVIPLWAEHLGIDAAPTSLIYGLSGAIDMLVFYPAGKLMDRKGRAWVAMPSTLIMGIAHAADPAHARLR